MTRRYTIGLVGNPNCGKTTLFNALTGSKQQVGNWPGVTVERKSGEYHRGDVLVEVIDLPGTYSLDVVEHEVSLDERVARDYVHENEADLIVNIVDAANLERNLYLTTQLCEMQVPLLVVMNMVDVADAKGMKVEPAQLSAQLGCPVVPIVASVGKGIEDLKGFIQQALEQPVRSSLTITYEDSLEQAVTQLAPKLPTEKLSSRWLAVRLLEGDDLARTVASAEAQDLAIKLKAELGDDLDIMVADARYGFANRMAGATVTHSGRVTRDISDLLDRVVLNRILGIPIFFFMMYLMFMFTINIGGAFIDFFDLAAAALLVDGFGELLTGLGAPDWLTALLAQGIGGGIQVILTFVPVIGFLYLFLSMLEDSGYMARAAFVMDRFMRWVGLPGKSFVPLIVGFGCNVPAVMATRTLEHRRDRLMTIAMTPFMSCGARLPVYVLFVAAFFPESGQNIIFGLYLIGILIAILTGLVLKQTLLEGDATPFIMELPPYHLPTLKGVLIHTWSRLKGFIFRAGRVIVPMVLVLNVLGSIGTDGTFGHEDTESSVLAATGRVLAPAFSPFGLDAENWPAAVGIFTGILAKEVVVGTLSATYGAMAAQETGNASEETPFALGAALAEAFATIPANLVDALGHWADPLGLTDDQSETLGDEVTSGTFGAMVERFDGMAGAFAYLLFILLYFPCTAATAAIYQEAGGRWTAFVAAWTTGVAYGLATLFYQIATWAKHPFSSLLWTLGMSAGFVLAFVMLWFAGHREAQNILSFNKVKGEI